ncbi:hypothetical protein, partial [Nocardia sp. NPDC019302]|uniref:hypothetical protein n=1 Tax=Nocardia sp. NPDC019302 TaxID=3154592 RepID=UPI0033C404CF
MIEPVDRTEMTPRLLARYLLTCTKTASLQDPSNGDKDMAAIVAAATSVAVRLLEAGLGRGDLVIVVGERPGAALPDLLGTWLAGCIA